MSRSGEVAEGLELPEEAPGEAYPLLNGVEDPLEIAAQALNKLRSEGLPTYIDEESEPADGSDATSSKVTSLEEYRQRHAHLDDGVDGHAQDEQEELTRIVMTPEQNAMLELFLESVEKVAKDVVYSWWKHPDELEEAIADGNLGLVKGVLAFDTDKVPDNASSSRSFIERYIRGYILHGMRRRYGRVIKSKKDKEAAAEVEELYGITGEDGIRKVKPSVAYGTAHSLDQEMEGEGEATLHDLIAHPTSHDEAIDGIHARDILAELMEGCPPEYREILFRRFVLDQTQTAIAEAVGFSQMHISRILRRELAKLEKTE